MRFSNIKSVDKYKNPPIFPVHPLFVWKGKLTAFFCQNFCRMLCVRCCLLLSVALNAGFDNYTLQFWVWWIQMRAGAQEPCSCKEKAEWGVVHNISWDLRKRYYTFFLLNLGGSRCGRDLEQWELSPWMAQLCVLLTLSPCSAQALPGREAPQHLQALCRGTAREAWDKRYCQHPA